MSNYLLINEKSVTDKGENPNHVQQINSSHASRRSHSFSVDDDFQVVTYKKSKPLFNTTDNNGISSPPNVQHTLAPLITTTVSDLTSVTTTAINASPRVPNADLKNQQQQQNAVLSASTRFALICFPFPPYIIRFNVSNISISHFKLKHNKDIGISHCRISKLKCNTDELDMLLYVKDPHSFAFLYDQKKLA